MKNMNLADESEKIYIIQPIIEENYKSLQKEAVSLIESSGALYAGTIYQKIREVNPATYIGYGKLTELRERLQGLDVTILFNGELSPSQTLNISAALDGKKVIDRTTLILAIFARNAKTNEGKIQVELAQLKYIYPRLKGKGEGLSRLGGGIGTRGPGETKLETDRRKIRVRISYLEDKLSQIESSRKLISYRRKRDSVKTISLIGYTNTGKSTLLNMLAGLERPTSGAVYIGRHRIDQMTERELTLFRQKFTGFVFQSYNLIPSLTALENVAMPLMFGMVSGVYSTMCIATQL